MNQKSAPQPAQQPSQADLDNRSNQLNSQHDVYWQSLGLPGKPEGDQTPAPPPPKKQ